MSGEEGVDPVAHARSCPSFFCPPLPWLSTDLAVLVADTGLRRPISDWAASQGVGFTSFLQTVQSPTPTTA